MKYKCIPVAAVLLFSAGCNNSGSAEEHADSANTLQDTFPASPVGDTVGLDSNAADATHVDSIHTINR